MTGVRWTICALIFFATTVNYLDRQIYSQLVPFFEDDLRLGPTDLALINVCFVVPYGLVMVFVGRFIDRVGIRKGLASIFLLWRLASMAHALVRNMLDLMAMRFLLGVGESGMFPSAVKTMTDWFPTKERSLAIGVFNAGANVGAILAPLIGVWIAVHYGWRTCFAATGAVGLIWIFFWLALYREPEENPKVSPEELAYIRSDPEPAVERVSYSQLFGIRPIYGLGVAKAITDAPWWFYLTWMPKFFIDQFHVSPTFMAWSVAVVYIVSDIGSVFGGWLSSRMISHGAAVGRARKSTMLICALAVVPATTIGLLVDHAPIAGIPAVFWAVAIVSIAAAGHQGWSCNLFTTISDIVPKKAIGMAVGAINGFAMIGVAAFQFFVGRVVQLTSSYTLVYLVGGTLYVIAWLILLVTVPRVEPDPATRRANLSYVWAGAAAVLFALGYLQFALNKPPYSSVQDYVAKRGAELHATDKSGPSATVGWMQARWYEWDAPGSPPQFELVKFDTAGRPVIESKGDKAAKYHGPPLGVVRAGFRPSS